MVTLKSSDGHLYEVEVSVANRSMMLRNMIDDTGSSDIIPLSNISGSILAKVIEFCKRREEATIQSDSIVSIPMISKFDQEFVDVDKGTLFELILAANYLCIEDLMDLTCMAAAQLIRGKSIDDIREIFNIENDLSPEEEEEYRKENDSIFG